MRCHLRTLSYFKADVGKIVASLLLIAVMTACGVLQPYPLRILMDNVIPDHSPADRVSRFFLAPAPSNQVGQIITLTLLVLGLRLVQEVLQMGMTLLNIKIGYSG